MSTGNKTGSESNAPRAVSLKLFPLSRVPVMRLHATYVAVAHRAKVASSSFCRGTGLPSRHWENKHHTLRGFFNCLRSRGCIVASPLQEPGPRALYAFQPYIYSHDELRRLLDATATLTSTRFPLQPLTYRTLILLLYGAGLRVGEAIRLRRCDVDLHDRLLSIWDTKFFKSLLTMLRKMGIRFAHPESCLKAACL